SDKSITYNGVTYNFYYTKEETPRMLIPMQPIQDCEAYYLAMTKKQAGTFVKNLSRYVDKFDEWQETAIAENVTDLKKSLVADNFFGINLKFKQSWYYSFAYMKNGSVYGAVIPNLTPNAQYIPEWFLEIDGNKNCYVSIESILPTQKFTDNQSVESTDDNGNTTVSKKYVKITPAGKLTMNKEMMQLLIDTIYDVSELLDAQKVEYKKHKLFKK
ncbi:MAG: hypothetical protein K6A98_07040, partial [Prevotella sp.]|nr:hypothetical protein [Prevotella sp.]